MRTPVFVICQGRTGGTMLSDLIARVPGCMYFLEPLHETLPRLMEKQNRRTAPQLKHDTLRDYPTADFLSFPHSELMERYAVRQSKDSRIRAWFRYLVEGAHALDCVPVFKVARLFGRLHLIREEFPDAAIIHLWRNLEAQRSSYELAGFPPDYFGDCAAYNLRPDEYEEAWHSCGTEAREVADLTIGYGSLVDYPQEELRRVLYTLGVDDHINEAARLAAIMGARCAT